jgi:hypothetical protein
MRKPHKHAELIKAWADGAEIEYRDTTRDVSLNPWRGLPPYGDWDASPVFEYRIKPEPKPDVVEEVSVYRNAFWQFELERKTDSRFKFQPIHLAEMRLTWDGKTGKLKSAEVL